MRRPFYLEFNNYLFVSTVPVAKLIIPIVSSAIAILDRMYPALIISFKMLNLKPVANKSEINNTILKINKMIPVAVHTEPIKYFCSFDNTACFDVTFVT